MAPWSQKPVDVCRETNSCSSLIWLVRRTFIASSSHGWHHSVQFSNTVDGPMWRMAVQQSFPGSGVTAFTAGSVCKFKFNFNPASAETGCNLSECQKVMNQSRRSKSFFLNLSCPAVGQILLLRSGFMCLWRHEEYICINLFCFWG